MDPAKRASVGTRVEEQVKDWLRYGEELGLGPYYRDRAPWQRSAETASLRPLNRLRSRWPPLLVRAALPTLRFPPRPRPSLRRLPKPAVAPAIVAPASLPSLFESIDRIADDTLPRIREDIGDCTRCKLHKGRTNIVFGVGIRKRSSFSSGKGPATMKISRASRSSAAPANY